MAINRKVIQDKKGVTYEIGKATALDRHKNGGYGWRFVGNDSKVIEVANLDKLKSALHIMYSGKIKLKKIRQ